MKKHMVSVSVLGVILALVMVVGSVFAGTLVINGSLDDGVDARYNRAFGCGSLSGIGTNTLYDAYTFQVDADGVYSMETGLIGLPDTVMTLHTPSFDSSDTTVNCLAYDDDISFPGNRGSRIEYGLTAETDYVVVVTSYENSEAGSYTLTIDGPGEICEGSGCAVPEPEPEEESTPVVEEEPAFSFIDGRINSWDMAAPVAVYPHVVNGEAGLIMYTPDGHMMMVVSGEDIANTPADGSNTLIAESNGVQLHRLSDGRLQVTAQQYNGKSYWMIFDSIASDASYASGEN